MDRVEAQKREYLRREVEVESFIRRLPTPVYRQLLRHYYLECLTFERVGEVMRKSERYTRQLHDAALVEAQRIWEKRKETN